MLLRRSRTGPGGLGPPGGKRYKIVGSDGSLSVSYMHVGPARGRWTRSDGSVSQGRTGPTETFDGRRSRVPRPPARIALRLMPGEPKLQLHSLGVGVKLFRSYVVNSQVRCCTLVLCYGKLSFLPGPTVLAAGACGKSGLGSAPESVPGALDLHLPFGGCERPGDLSGSTIPRLTSIPVH